MMGYLKTVLCSKQVLSIRLIGNQILVNMPSENKSFSQTLAYLVLMSYCTNHKIATFHILEQMKGEPNIMF